MIFYHSMMFIIFSEAFIFVKFKISKTVTNCDKQLPLIPQFKIASNKKTI